MADESTNLNRETVSIVTEHAVEIRHLAEHIGEMKARVDSLCADIRGLREDVRAYMPMCRVHEEQIRQLEETVGQRTAGGVIGLLALVGYAVQDVLGRRGP